MSRIPNPSTRSTPSTPSKSSVRSTTRTTTTTTTTALRTRTTSTTNPLITDTPRTRTTSTISRARTPASPTPTLRPQTSSKSLRSPSKPSRRTSPVEDPPPIPKAPALSIKEQIALKRAEAQKAKAAQVKTNNDLDFEGLEDASPNIPKEDVLDLGRWSVKETIERARSSGALNLASRSLPCLPSALFEIHLGITPEPLKLVPVEPPITTATSDDPSASRRRGANHQGPSWFEAQDLEIIKAWSNEIVEIQPEINMFGSLKIIDLHNNKLKFLPDTFADLTALVNLDLSHNQLTSLPTNIWALPDLTTLNLSHNALAALPFSSPFAAKNATPLARTNDPRGDWYGQDITRANKPLPKLTALDVSHNHITASAIDGDCLPEGVTKLDISFNPLGNCVAFIRSLSWLRNLQELKATKASIGDDSFPVDLLSAGSNHSPFAQLDILDLEETKVSKPVLEAAFLPDIIHKTLDFDIINEPVKAGGVLRVIVGKKIVKEAWEIEAERSAAARLHKGRHTNLDSSEDNGFGTFDVMSTSMNASTPTTSTPQAHRAYRELVKERWEIEAEQGLLTEGAKRRARALAAAQNVSSSSPISIRSSSSNASSGTQASPQKEAWEIEAEQGLLTAGGRRRARAAAMAKLSATGSPGASVPAQRLSTESTEPSTSSVLSSPQYYNSSSETLTLPSSVPPAVKNALGHARSFSLAPAKSAAPTIGNSSSDLALAIPTPTLPLTAIVSQSFASTLKILILKNRRMDPCFNLLDDVSGSPLLPQLEELSLENCNLGDTIPVTRSQEGSAPRTNEPLLPLISKVFPSLRTLDLSYNHLSSNALGGDVLSAILLAVLPRKGLRHLRLRGNRLTDVDGFISVASLFKGHKDSRDVESWKLEELDVRDNEIGRLPPELGLLPLDVLLVDGNIFRAPPRRVWEREGTKGLLSWLRGRIE